MIKIDTLPGDCTMLPVSGGALLVSRQHAVFCRVPAGDVGCMHTVLRGLPPARALGRTLHTALDEHGFFGPPRTPKADAPSVQIQLTNACNLACAYCCTNSGRQRPQETDFAKLVQVVRQIPEVLGSRTHVALLGGEPLLVPWSIDLARELVRLNLQLTIFTNGILLSDDRLAREVAMLIGQGVEVRVSLGGPTGATCDLASGGHRFEPALLGIQKLAAFGAHVSVDVMFMPQNVDTLAAEICQLRTRLPEDTRIALGVLYRSGRESGERLFENRADLESALDRIAFDGGVSIPADAVGPVMDRRDGCVCATGQHVHLRSDGALFSCFKMEEAVGHLDTIGFAAAARWIREHPHPATSLPTCTDCPLATLCGGGCRSENLLYTGCPDTPPCGPWRVRVLSELLAEDRITAVEWPVAFLVDEARRRGIYTPSDLVPRMKSRHLVDV